MTHTADKAQQRFTLFTRASLILLAVVMAGLWYLAAPGVLTPEERQLWQKVRAAQLHLSQWRTQQDTAARQESDPWNCGLIGLEWSGITTTLGELGSKRTACNPAWAIQFSRWFHEQGLEAGDPVAIYASGSFPGLTLNAIAAAETMELRPLLIVSLGASTWGANHPDAPWPVLAAELRRSGFIRKRADYYTLGGGAELGHGLAPEGEALLRKAASEAGVELLTAANLADMITRKTDLLVAHGARLLISIGGSQANLGDALEVLKLEPGVLTADNMANVGNGVIGAAAQQDIPVIHMLNIKSLGNMTGIPYDSPPRLAAPTRVSKWWSAIGVALFFIVVLRHKRWRLEPPEV
jgi:poly-gamma-glutamate system protein